MSPPPGGARSNYTHALLAGVDVSHSSTCFALDVTTPVEFTMASLGDCRFVCVVAPSAAHEVAAVHALRLPVTLAPGRAERAGLLVRVAVVGALVQVEQVLLVGLVVLGVGPDQLGALPVELHLGGAVVLLLEAGARLPERRQLVPAGLEAAGARHAVALAGYLSVAVDGLKAHRGVESIGE